PARSRASSPPASLLRRRDRGAPLLLWKPPRIGARGTDFEVAEVQLARELETAPKAPRAVMAAQPPRAPGGRGPQARSDRRRRPGPGGPGHRPLGWGSGGGAQPRGVGLRGRRRAAGG